MAKLFLVPKQDAEPRQSPTTIQLTFAQRLALHRLQIKRMVEGQPKPTISEMVADGLALLFKKEGI